jgi:hypothetical protein
MMYLLNVTATAAEATLVLSENVRKITACVLAHVGGGETCCPQ